MSILIIFILLKLFSDGRTYTVVTDSNYEYGIFENFGEIKDVFIKEQQLVKEINLTKGTVYIFSQQSSSLNICSTKIYLIKLSFDEHVFV